MRPMNDPHVTALHYWVEHDDSVDYDIAVPLWHEDELVKVHLEKRELTLHPKEHYASSQEAREAVAGFIRNWEFDATVEAGSRQFELKYMYADIIDRKPAPSPPGVVNASMSARAGFPKVSLHLTVGKAKYPSPRKTGVGFQQPNGLSYAVPVGPLPPRKGNAGGDVIFLSHSDVGQRQDRKGNNQRHAGGERLLCYYA